MAKLTKILVPVDSSESASKAAAFAADLASAIGASLTLLHVFDRDALSAAIMGAEALSDEELERSREHFAEEAFGAARDAIGADVEANTEFRFGKPAFEIVDFAEDNDFDLIVMGSRGQSAIQRLLVGSVSTQVVHHAKCSVTIVR